MELAVDVNRAAINDAVRRHKGRSDPLTVIWSPLATAVLRGLEHALAASVGVPEV